MGREVIAPATSKRNLDRFSRLREHEKQPNRTRLKQPTPEITMKDARHSSLLALAVVGLLEQGAAGQESAESAGGDPDRLFWDARNAEHLFNRAGFGASARTIVRSLEQGAESVVDELIEGEGWVVEPFYARLRGGMESRERLKRLPDDMREEARRRMRREEAAQVRDFLGWWTERMLSGQDDLRERMTLFWHGHFTSSMQDVKNSHEMILQNQLLRQNALGNFGDLVHAIARDPAMLEYLDNDSNRKASPNENFARELMELFTIGEGHYTEEDIKEAARAFTGWSDRFGKFRFSRRHHDAGEKTVLGISGHHDGDDVIDILLQQESCTRYIAGKLLTYFEGAQPDEERLSKYAGLLRELDLEIAPFLKRLFLDPDFYREEVVGGRIASPIDFLVGAARRLSLDPPERLVLAGAASLGEKLFYPPNVKGWDGGETWITTGSLMQRGNLAGVLLGRVELTNFLNHDPLESQDVVLNQSQRKRSPAEIKRLRRTLGVLRDLKEVERAGWRPRINLSGRLKADGVVGDRDIVRALCDALLAIEVGDETHRALTGIWIAMREEQELQEHDLWSSPKTAEDQLRTLAHVILSLPEAQLN